MYTVYLAWLQSSTRELQWLEYLKSIFLKIPNVTTWLVFQNQVTIDNLLADLLIRQTFFHQMLEKSLFTKLSSHLTFPLYGS